MTAIAMAVGAMDSYFKDKYIDCVTSALQAYTKNKWKVNFPASYLKFLPVGKALKAWDIRMEIRNLMNKKSMFSISKLDGYFNPILSEEAKLWNAIIEDFIKLDRKRFTGISWGEYNIRTGDNRTKAKQEAFELLKKRLDETVQLRHDYIHNCGRPNLVIIDLTLGGANARIKEIKTFVTQIDDHIEKNRLDRNRQIEIG